MTKETAKSEDCSHCKSVEFLVHHYLIEGHHDRIYLECAHCGELASRLIVHAQVSPDSYEEFLQKITRTGAMSPREIIESSKIHAERAIEQFSHVKEILSDLEKSDKKHTVSITQLYQEYNIVEDG